MTTPDPIFSLLEDSQYRMVSILNKAPSLRRALARGRIHVGAEAFQKIQAKDMPKGDPLTIAEIAAISGAKKTVDLLPLCHPLPLEQVLVSIVPHHDKQSYTVYCLASTFGKTGVEMEALTGVSTALLCIYDLTKIIEPALRISETVLLFKEGGKSGIWIHPEASEELDPSLIQSLMGKKVNAVPGIKASLLTISDRASQGVYEDKSGPLLKALLTESQLDILDEAIVADNPDDIREKVRHMLKTAKPDLLITSGGTGLSERDQTAQTLLPLFEKPAPGLAEMLRSKGSQFTEFSWLSQSVAGMIGQTLIITFPGSPKAVEECWQILSPVLPTLFKVIKTGNCES